MYTSYPGSAGGLLNGDGTSVMTGQVYPARKNISSAISSVVTWTMTSASHSALLSAQMSSHDGQARVLWSLNVLKIQVSPKGGGGGALGGPSRHAQMRLWPASAGTWLHGAASEAP